MRFVKDKSVEDAVFAQLHRVVDNRLGTKPTDGAVYVKEYIEQCARYDGCSLKYAEQEVKERIDRFRRYMITGVENPIHFTISCEEVERILTFFQTEGWSTPEEVSVGLVHSYDLNFRSLATQGNRAGLIFNTVMYDFLSDIAMLMSLPALSFILDPSRAFGIDLVALPAMGESIAGMLAYFACKAEYQRSTDDPSKFKLIAHIGGSEFPRFLAHDDPRLEEERFQLWFQMRETLNEFAVGHEAAHSCVDCLSENEKATLGITTKEELECYCDELAVRYVTMERLKFAVRFSEHLNWTFVKIALPAVLFRFLEFYEASRKIRQKNASSTPVTASASSEGYPEFRERASRSLDIVEDVFIQTTKGQGVKELREIAKSIDEFLCEVYERASDHLANRLGFERAGVDLSRLSEAIDQSMRDHR